MDLLHGLSSDLLAFARDHIYLALFVLLMIEEAGVPLPVPGDSLILLAGASAGGSGGIAIALVLILVAVLIGSSVLYWIAHFGGMAVLDRITRILRIKRERLDRVSVWFRRHPGPAIVVGRLTPGFRTATSAVSGTFGVPYPTFLLFTWLAALIWALLYLLLGQALHNAYRWVADVAFRPSPLGLLLLLFALVALGVAVTTVVRRRRGGGARTEC